MWTSCQAEADPEKAACAIFSWNMQVPATVIDEVACEDDKERYKRFRLRSFVEDNRMYEWCPAPDCEFAVESYVGLQGEPLDVACTCGATFCFSCKEEAHRPVSHSTL